MKGTVDLGQLHQLGLAVEDFFIDLGAELLRGLICQGCNKNVWGPHRKEEAGYYFREEWNIHGNAGWSAVLNHIKHIFRVCDLCQDAFYDDDISDDDMSFAEEEANRYYDDDYDWHDTFDD